ncbi:hypothetical protein V6N11_078890 [Hibiscus sabdariffa]|uniref:RNase H type-1 domain-containing protein n=1 Tax=Hibiscus sabdariffa TaxID=183260 RepID=A0ABR2RUG4_9ROSI
MSYSDVIFQDDGGRETETVDYVLRHCSKATRVWQGVILPDNLQSFYGLPFIELMAINIRGVGDLIQVSHRLLNDYVVAFSKTCNERIARRPSAIGWQCPPDGWIKINSDGAMHPSSDKAAAVEF